jgi:predicted flap endonuclease-1-like 5' DNA nuclease
MSFLVGHYLGWMAAAFLLGAAIAWFAARRAGGEPKAGAYWLVLGAIALALAIAFTHTLPGRLGHGLEVVLLLLISYLVGCLIGEILRRLAAPPERAAQSIQQAAHGLPVTVPAMAPAMDAASSAAHGAQSFMRQADQAAAAYIPDEPVADEHKPLLLAGPPLQGADDLKLIWGVGPKLETLLNELGVYRFEQIASWNEMNLRWVDQNLEAFKGRAIRDRWIEQSRKLAAGWRPDSEVGEKFKG